MENSGDGNFGVILENHTVRLENLEKQLEQLQTISESIQNLTISVNQMAINMEHMIAEQKNQGEKIQNLEDEPANNWKSVKGTAITSAVSAIVGAFIAYFMR